MANNIDKKEPVTNCEQSKIDIIKCDNHELAGNIEPLIKVIRGQQVMLDRDLATLYGVETKRLNEQVKRNIKRFPEDFMFQLTKDECLRSQIATLNEGRGQHLKYMPYVFTENGVAMLSSVLRSDPDGCGDYYTNKGICLGTDKKNNNSRTPLSSSNL